MKTTAAAAAAAGRPSSPSVASSTIVDVTKNRPATSYKLWIALASILTLNCFIYLVNFSSRPVLDGYHEQAAWHASVMNVSHATVKSDVVTDDSSEQRPEDGAPRTTSARSSTTSNNKQQDPKKYNVMIFYPDDWRHDSLGIAKTQPVQTPFLDQLSREGVRFVRNYVSTSICWISRATMFTGQYFARHQARFIRQPVFYDRWNQSYIYTLQQKAGYFVGHIGKWQFRDGGFVGENYNWSSLYEGVHWHTIDGEQVHSTTRDEQNAIRFLRERPKNVPFVLTTAFYAPKAVGEKPDQHFPMDKSEPLYANVTIPPPIDPEWAFQQLPQFMQDNAYYLEGRRRYMQRFNFNVSGMYERFQKKYFRMITEVDEAIKNVVAELETQGELDNTIIIFTTDNGLYHGEHGLAGKWFPHDESIRIPLIIKDPRMSADVRGKDIDEFTLNVDLATTILGAAGLPPNPTMQGRDIADLYLKPKAKDTWRKEFYYEHPPMGYKKGIPESRALVRKNFKYILWVEYKYEQLFDMINDPYEHTDVAQKPEHAELMKEMRARCEELRKSVI